MLSVLEKNTFSISIIIRDFAVLLRKLVFVVSAKCFFPVSKGKLSFGMTIYFSGYGENIVISREKHNFFLFL